MLAQIFNRVTLLVSCITCSISKVASVGATVICHCSNVIRISPLYHRPSSDLINYFSYSGVGMLIVASYKFNRRLGSA
jgi:hypothetical protein